MQVLDAPNVRSKTYERQYLQGKMFGPYSFISVPSGKEESDDFGHSKRNMVEVALVIKIVQNLYKCKSSFCFGFLPFVLFWLVNI